jgi:hypothetical protein
MRCPKVERDTTYLCSKRSDHYREIEQENTPPKNRTQPAVNTISRRSLSSSSGMKSDGKYMATFGIRDQTRKNKRGLVAVM